MAGDTIVCACIDKKGNPFGVACCSDMEHAAMAAMYDRFSPKGISQGLPPAADKTRRVWVDQLCVSGENFGAWVDDRLVGHSCLLPDLARNDAEFIIFVEQGYRNRGLGTELTRLALDRARQLGLHSVWLAVEVYNFRAIKLYKNFGFRFCDECDRERIMMLDLDPANEA